MVANDTASTFATLAYGAIGGALTTFVALRTRLAIMQRDIADNKLATTELAARLDAQLRKMDRRQIISLQVIADIARKVQADGRFSDQLVRFLATDAESGDAPV